MGEAPDDEGTSVEADGNDEAEDEPVEPTVVARLVWDPTLQQHILEGGDEPEDPSAVFARDPEGTIGRAIDQIPITEGMERSSVEVTILGLLPLIENDTTFLAVIEREIERRISKIRKEHIEPLDQRLQEINTELGRQVQVLPRFEEEVKRAILADRELREVLQQEYYLSHPQGLWNYWKATRRHRSPCFKRNDPLFSDARQQAELRAKIKQDKERLLKSIFARSSVDVIPDVHIAAAGGDILPMPIPLAMIRIQRSNDGQAKTSAGATFFHWLLENHPIGDSRLKGRKEKKAELAEVGKKREKYEKIVGYFIESRQTITGIKRGKLGLEVDRGV